MSLPVFTLVILVLAIIQGTGLVGSTDVFEPVLHRHGSHGKDQLSRQIRSVLSMLHSNDYTSAKEQAESVVAHLRTLENNIKVAGPRLEAGNAAYMAMLISRADKKACSIGRTAYINSWATNYISSKRCTRLINNPLSCAEELRRLSDNKALSINCQNTTYRTYEGNCNNNENPTWGAAYTPYERIYVPIYLDGIWEQNTFFNHLPNSLTVGKETANMMANITPNSLYTISLAGWTNIVLYDLSHTVSYKMLHSEADIVCCSENNRKISPRFLHPFCMPLVSKNGECINYVRSMLSTLSDQIYGPAQQMNMASHYLDGSSIYGTTAEIADTLRLKQDGLLKELNYHCKKGQPCQFSGDIRPIMDPVTAVIHVVLIREHNRIAKSLSKLNPTWSDETLFQEARRIVIAEIQHITYKEWLPIIIGDSLNRQKYDANIHPGVYNSFANAASYFALSLFPDKIRLYNEDRSQNTTIPWRYSIVDPDLLNNNKKFDSLIRSLSTQTCQQSNLKFTKAVTQNFFGKGKNDGLNILSLIVQRGRDHGLPSYMTFRKLFGFPHNNFEDLVGDMPLMNYQILRNLYSDEDTIDLFIGGMAETPKTGAIVGPILSKIISRQMMITRVGDKYFYENNKQKTSFTEEQLNEIRKSSFARLLCDNSENVQEMQPNAFKIIDKINNNLVDCSDESKIPKMDLSYWKY
ncbi:hypothetical protein O3M35_013037 [Rhynocoris fuscipes]|uniref:Peroxidase n=1 Tax=Rhynocoris fuscipes TaxID=488301 RepID=A0AAW1CHD1_9HEMI